MNKLYKKKYIAKNGFHQPLIFCASLVLASVMSAYVHEGLAQSTYDKELQTLKTSTGYENYFKYAKTKNPRSMELYKEGTYLINVIGRKDKKERMAEGIRRLEQALELDSTFAAAHVSLGNAYWLSAVLKLYKKRDMKNQEQEVLAEKARTEYRKAIELDPTNVEAHLKIAATTRDPDEELRHYKTAFDLDPHQYIHPMVGARIAESEGRVQEAFNYLIQGLVGTRESDRCSLVKGPFSSTEYGLGFFQKKYPEEYKAYVGRVCSGKDLPLFEPYGEYGE